MALTPEQRFWNRTDQTGGAASCWNWTGAIDSNGYGACGYNGKKVNTHRLAWKLANGPIQGRFDVRHSCDNRKCCNPAHLSLGTRGENMRDAVERARTAKGEYNGLSILSEPLVKAIKILAQDHSSYWIHKTLGLSKTTVLNITRGVTWKHIDILQIESSSK